MAVERLLASLRRLDRVLEQALGADIYHEMNVSSDETVRLIAREPDAPLLWAGNDSAGETLPGADTEGSRLKWLKDTFGLTDFDLDVIILALAPELDTRYERLYAYLREHVIHRQVDVDLALNLLCSTAEEKLTGRTRFAPDAPLLGNRLIHLASEFHQPRSSLLSSTITLDEQIINLLLYQGGLDSRLASFCTLTEPDCGLDNLSLTDESRRALLSLTAQACWHRRQLHFYFQGPRGAGKKMTAAALAFDVGMPLLVADLQSAADRGSDFGELFGILFREAWFKDAILCLEETDALLNDERLAAKARLFFKALTEHPGIAMCTGTRPWPQHGLEAAGVITVPFTSPDFYRRRNCWRQSLTVKNINLDEGELDTLAGRFRLTRRQIASAVICAGQQACWNAAAAATPETSAAAVNAQPVLKDIFAAVRAQSGHELASLTAKVDTDDTWDDLVLPGDAMTQLRELTRRVAYRRRVMDEWGFNRKLPLGKGVNALFAGPSGTGKTMAAGVVANELGLDLYRIDLSGVVSKYIGETEKNLDRIFIAAETSNAILFFDEADALFGKRSEVRDAHDRYANIEISYLLQKMEQYEGITILATNLRQNLDDAFVRRIAFTVHFPFPDEEGRRRIWSGIWPKAAPLAGDVDLDCLARRFRLSGGNIKNIALAASFLAANRDEITMEHLIAATGREYQKMGKNLSEAELYGDGSI